MYSPLQHEEQVDQPPLLMALEAEPGGQIEVFGLQMVGLENADIWQALLDDLADARQIISHIASACERSRLNPDCVSRQSCYYLPPALSRVSRSLHISMAQYMAFHQSGMARIAATAPT